jgi:hypothetical protein
VLAKKEVVVSGKDVPQNMMLSYVGFLDCKTILQVEKMEWDCEMLPVSHHQQMNAHQDSLPSVSSLPKNAAEFKNL